MNGNGLYGGGGAERVRVIRRGLCLTAATMNCRGLDGRRPRLNARPVGSRAITVMVCLDARLSFTDVAVAGRLQLEIGLREGPKPFIGATNGVMAALFAAFPFFGHGR